VVVCVCAVNDDNRFVLFLLFGVFFVFFLLGLIVIAIVWLLLSGKFGKKPLVPKAGSDETQRLVAETKVYTGL
jgi:hypothetical protein